MAISVNDAVTREPVGGAAVHAQPMKFFIPSPPYSFLNPFGYDADSTVTDGHGRAELVAYTERPTQISVFADGYVRYVGIIEYRGTDAASDAPRWTIDAAVESDDAAEPYLDVSVAE